MAKPDKLSRIVEDLIKDLRQLMEGTDLTELSVQQGEIKVTLKREVAGVTKAVPQAAQVAQATGVKPPPEVAPVAPVEAEEASAAAESPTEPAKKTITSPTVGIFLLGKNAPKEGDRVQADQEIGVVQSLGFDHEVKATSAGKIASYLVKNEEAVEYGQPIAVVEE